MSPGHNCSLHRRTKVCRRAGRYREKKFKVCVNYLFEVKEEVRAAIFFLEPR